MSVIEMVKVRMRTNMVGRQSRMSCQVTDLFSSSSKSGSSARVRVEESDLKLLENISYLFL